MTHAFQLPERSDYQAYLYDCDGTLADTMGLHSKAWVEELQAQKTNLSAETITSIISELAGMPSQKLIGEFNSRFNLNLHPMTTAEKKEKRFLENYLAHVTPIAPVVNHLLAHRTRAKIAVVSGGHREVIEKTLRIIGIFDHVEVIVGTEDVKHGKPAPDPFLLAAQKLGVRPEDCLVFEDGELGVQSAIAAKMDWVRIVSSR